MTYTIFHLAFPVHSLEAAKQFYVSTLGAKIGRKRERWIDIFLFGGQITLHEQPSQVLPLDGHGVRHFGAVLPWHEWEALAKRLEGLGMAFKVAPNVSHQGTTTEQAKMLLTDPSGNVRDKSL